MRSTDSMDSTLSDRKKLALFEAIGGESWLLKLDENEELSDHFNTLAHHANTARAANGGIGNILEQVEIRRQRMLTNLHEFFETN